MLVKRQSSSFNVGNPSSAKLANPALRMGKSHRGCTAVSTPLNSFTIGSTASLEFFGVIVGIPSNVHLSMQRSHVQVWTRLFLRGKLANYASNAIARDSSGGAEIRQIPRIFARHRFLWAGQGHRCRRRGG